MKFTICYHLNDHIYIIDLYHVSALWRSCDSDLDASAVIKDGAGVSSGVCWVEQQKQTDAAAEGDGAGGANAIASTHFSSSVADSSTWPQV